MDLDIEPSDVLSACEVNCKLNTIEFDRSARARVTAMTPSAFNSRGEIK